VTNEDAWIQTPVASLIDSLVVTLEAVWIVVGAERRRRAIERARGERGDVGDAVPRGRDEVGARSVPEQNEWQSPGVPPQNPTSNVCVRVGRAVLNRLGRRREGLVAASAYAQLTVATARTTRASRMPSA